MDDLSIKRMVEERNKHNQQALLLEEEKKRMREKEEIIMIRIPVRIYLRFIRIWKNTGNHKRFAVNRFDIKPVFGILARYNAVFNQGFPYRL